MIGCFRVQPERQFTNGRIQSFADCNRGWSIDRRFVAFPKHVKDDIFESGIAIMAMCAPAAGMQVHFDVARTRRCVAELNNAVLEVRPAFAIQKTGMKNPHPLASESFEILPLQTLMLPDGLKQIFRWNFVIFVKQERGTAVLAPLGVRTVGNRKHLAAFLPFAPGKVKRAFLRLKNLHFALCSMGCAG